MALDREEKDDIYIGNSSLKFSKYGSKQNQKMGKWIWPLLSREIANYLISLWGLQFIIDKNITWRTGMALNRMFAEMVHMPNVPQHLPSARRPLIVLLHLVSMRRAPFELPGPLQTNPGSSKRSLCSCHCWCMISTQCHVVATASLEFKHGLRGKWTGNHHFYNPKNGGFSRVAVGFPNWWRHNWCFVSSADASLSWNVHFGTWPPPEPHGDAEHAMETPGAGPQIWVSGLIQLRRVTFAQWACPNMPQCRAK